MGIELLISLIGLALIDSTRIGTLLIPIWLLLDHRQLRASSMMIYLLTIAGFYLLMGLAIMWGADLLPYLGAIALIASAQRPWHLVFALMFAYCLMMILPAMVLLVLRKLLGQRIRPMLIKVDSWITKNAASALGWVLGIAGFLIASDALTRLWIVWFA